MHSFAQTPLNQAAARILLSEGKFEVVIDYGPHQSSTYTVTAPNEDGARTKALREFKKTNSSDLKKAYVSSVNLVEEALLSEGSAADRFAQIKKDLELAKTRGPKFIAMLAKVKSGIKWAAGPKKGRSSALLELSGTLQNGEQMTFMWHEPDKYGGSYTYIGALKTPKNSYSPADFGPQVNTDWIYGMDEAQFAKNLKDFEDAIALAAKIK